MSRWTISGGDGRRCTGGSRGAVFPAPRSSTFQHGSPIDPERSLAQREIGGLLERAIDDLPAEFRTVLMARVVEDMSIQETAELFGIRPETVKTRLHRARWMVRQALEEKLGPAVTGVFPFAGRRCERLADTVIARLPRAALIPREPFRFGFRSNMHKTSGQTSGVDTARGPAMFRTIAAAVAAIALMTGLAQAQAPAPALNDAQIAHIAYTAGQIDIDAAKLALSKSTNPMVIDFANNMVKDHQSVNDQALALVKKLNVTPQDNDTSKALTAAAAVNTKQLSGLTGAAFDKAYIANEVAYHPDQRQRGADKMLIPAAAEPGLEGDLLTTGLKIFQRPGCSTRPLTMVAAMLKSMSPDPGLPNRLPSQWRSPRERWARQRQPDQSHHRGYRVRAGRHHRPRRRYHRVDEPDFVAYYVDGDERRLGRSDRGRQQRRAATEAIRRA